MEKIYRVIEVRKFIDVDIKGLTIEHRTFDFDDYRSACKQANDRKGVAGGFYDIGSPYIVIDARVEELENPSDFPHNEEVEL